MEGYFEFPLLNQAKRAVVRSPDGGESPAEMAGTWVKVGQCWHGATFAFRKV
jgi:hypothetical protein